MALHGRFTFPTAFTILYVLIHSVEYEHWLRFIWPLLLLMTLLIMTVLRIGAII